ncbi:hypothetical protein [Paraflavitalea pollutisoli]|uniref:hypothetical protein n=1 Tax=Paraflavitalea pollutisoli TaxID=3034143 RepID=UPI0023ECD60B|nr:hypothetical protein [Paraflavitalea sp. H1-2-19X]
MILYYPEKDVLSNVLSYSSQVDKVYLADNSEKPDTSLVKALRQGLPHGEYLQDGVNKGIAARLNQVCQLAKAAGYDYLLTMDQDSLFSGNNLTDYLHCFETFPDRDKVAMCGVEYQHSDWLSAQCKAEQCTQLITSGSFLNLHLWESMGGFDENLFIDMVDFEFCYRAIVRGHQIVIFKNIVLDHFLGTTSFRSEDSGEAKRERTLYSPIRLYYMYRNYLYMKKRYEQHFPGEIRQTQLAVRSRIKNNLLLKKDRLKILRYLIRAVSDHRSGKMGKYQH